MEGAAAPSRSGGDAVVSGRSPGGPGAHPPLPRRARPQETHVPEPPETAGRPHRAEPCGTRRLCRYLLPARPRTRPSRPRASLDLRSPARLNPSAPVGRPKLGRPSGPLPDPLPPAGRHLFPLLSLTTVARAASPSSPPASPLNARPSHQGTRPPCPLPSPWCPPWGRARCTPLAVAAWPPSFLPRALAPPAFTSFPQPAPPLPQGPMGNTHFPSAPRSRPAPRGW